MGAKMAMPPKAKNGFTLIELLAVIGILSLLATILMISLQNARTKSRDAKRISNTREVAKALELYYATYSQYPPLTIAMGNPPDPNLGCWNTSPSCDSRIDTNWNDLLDILKNENLISSVGDIHNSLQDPKYPGVDTAGVYRYAYMPAANPPFQSFRIRTQLEEQTNVALRDGLRGKFFWSDEDDTNNPPDSCSPQIGLYCVGPNTTFEAFDPGKPVIYLYPTQTQKVMVSFKAKSIEQSIPEYKDGWEVVAHPDGSIYNPDDGKIYPYLYWEGGSEQPHVDRTKGFVVSEDKIELFLNDKLQLQGLNRKETAEFIAYWVPRMQGKKYVYVYFMPKNDYDKLIPLEVNPRPDTVIRVYMLFRKLEKPIKVDEQKLESKVRDGFTVVEWGGDRQEIRW